MNIQFNADLNISDNHKLSSPTMAIIKKELSRFSPQIARLKVDLTDEKRGSSGQYDKQCVIKAHLEDMRPIAVIKHANAHEQATKGASSKLQASIKTILGRLESNN
jgi:hypothetical protein